MSGPVLNPYAPPAADREQQWGGYQAYIDAEFQLASLGARWWGAFIDNLLLYASAIPTVVALYASDKNLILTGAVALLTALPFSAYQWYLIATRGQSLGKRVARTRITRLDGSAPGFVNGVLIRSWIVSVVASVFGPAALVDAVFVFRNDRRTVHDLMAGTRVIQA